MRLTDDAKAIMVFLKRVGNASPVEICRFINLSRTTVFRRLRELHRCGVIEKIGNTSAVKYKIIREQMETPSAGIAGTGETKECQTAVAK